MIKEKLITVFTPTYNRAYCLHQVYESLLKQTSKDFEWLIIDDGSTDNTKSVVQGWMDENKVRINYIYQVNQGMHGAHNTAYANIKTELNVCIDSDDFMPDNAIELILSFWKKYGSDRVAGIVGLDSYKNGKIVSSKKFPKNIKKGKYYELKSKFNISGDIKFVYKTEIIKKYPSYPVFKGENFVPLGYKYMLIDQDYDLLFLNKVLCIVEYLEDGSSKNIIKQYIKNPKGFAHERKIRMIYSKTFKERFKNAVHYVSCSIFLKNYNFIKESSNKSLTVFAIPIGIILNLYIKYLNKKNSK